MSEDNGSESSLLQRFLHLASDDNFVKIVAWYEKVEGKIDIGTWS